MSVLCLLLFVVNLLLTLLDASVAYHKAPRFVAFINPDPDGRASGTRKLKSLLPLLVALYVSLDCYAYSLRHMGYLTGLAVLLAADIYVQCLISGKGESCQE